MRLPVCIAQLVRNQGISCLGVGHAQKGFGECEKRDAFLRVEPVLIEKLVHPAGGLRAPQICEQTARACDDAAAFVGR